MIFYGGEIYCTYLYIAGQRKMISKCLCCFPFRSTPNSYCCSISHHYSSHPSARPAKDVDHDEEWPQSLYSRFEDVDGFLKIFHLLDDHFSWFYLLFVSVSLNLLLETLSFYRRVRGFDVWASTKWMPPPTYLERCTSKGGLLLVVRKGGEPIKSTQWFDWA